MGMVARGQVQWWKSMAAGFQHIKKITGSHICMDAKYLRGKRLAI